MNKGSIVILTTLVAALGLASYHLAASRQQQADVPATLMGTLWPEPRPLSQFRLSDHTGAAFGPEELRGQWTLMFFGYASCPDICPTTMLTLRGVVDALAASGAGLPRVVLVTVDPDRDDAATLGEYVAYFNEDFLGVRGEEGQLQALARQIGAMYERGTPDVNGNYEVAHNASIFLVDPEARMHAAFSPPHKSADIADKLVEIRLRYERG